MRFLHKVGTINTKRNRIVSLFLVAMLIVQPVFSIISETSVDALSGTVHTTNLTGSGWDFSETRSKGHNQLVAGGLRVWTDTNDSESKAAGYYQTPGLTLAEIAATSIDFQSFIDGRPSVQLGVDRDGNGSWDGYLVYEPWSYGNGQYWTNKTGFGVPAGGGYESMGTLEQYQAANPSAKVTSIGYSLGSGLKGDAIISKITIGERTFTFSATAPAVPTGLDYAAPNQSCNGYTNSNYSQPKWNAVTDAVSYDYEALRDGSVVYSANFATNSHPGGAFGDGQNTTWGFRVRSVAANGLKSAWASTCSITLDTVKPTATITSPSSDNQLLPANPTITGVVAADELNLKSHWFEITNPDGSYTYENVANSTNLSHSFTLDTSKGSGQYKIRYVATDKAGNRSDDPAYTNSTVRTVQVDAQKPSIYIKGKANSYEPTSVGDHASNVYKEISFKLYDAQKITRYVLNGQSVNVTPNSWSDANFSNIKNKLVEGANSLTVYDTSGNSSTLEFLYDTTAPTATISYTPEGPAKTKNNVTVTLTANEPIKQTALPGTWLRVSDTVYKKVFPANAVQNVTLEDLAGNLGSTTVTIDWIDKTAPTYTITSPLAGQTLAPASSGNKITVLGSFADNLGGSGANYIQLQLVKDGNSVGISTVHGQVENGILGEFDTSGLGDGTYELNVIGAADGVGNWAPLSSRTIIIDNSITVSLSQTVFNSSTPELAGAAQYTLNGLPAANTELVITINGVDYTTTTDSDGNWAITLLTPLANNTYPVLATINGRTLTLDPVTINAPSDQNENPGNQSGNTGNSTNNGSSNTGSTSSSTGNTAQAVVASAISQPFTTFGFTIDNTDGTIAATPIPDDQADTTDNQGSVLGAKDTAAQTTTRETDSTTKGFLSKRTTYWIIGGTVALLGFWWFIAAKRRKKRQEEGHA
jgi:hypothetical protein